MQKLLIALKTGLIFFVHNMFFIYIFGWNMTYKSFMFSYGAYREWGWRWWRWWRGWHEFDSPLSGPAARWNPAGASLCVPHSSGPPSFTINISSADQWRSTERLQGFLDADREVCTSPLRPDSNSMPSDSWRAKSDPLNLTTDMHWE